MSEKRKKSALEPNVEVKKKSFTEKWYFSFQKPLFRRKTFFEVAAVQSSVGNVNPDLPVGKNKKFEKKKNCFPISGLSAHPNDCSSGSLYVEFYSSCSN